jgi:hypothetical protein
MADLLEELLHRALVSDVHRHRMMLITKFFRASLRAVGIEVGDRDGASLGCQRLGGSPPDARGCTDDNCNSIVAHRD